MILVITALFLITSNGCTNLMILVITACLFPGLIPDHYDDIGSSIGDHF